MTPGTQQAFGGLQHAGASSSLTHVPAAKQGFDCSAAIADGNVHTVTTAAIIQIQSFLPM